ncbi:hypothetical protein B0920_06105 [Massilia sp. KIM]|uniref:hypothetical protein n=1 Tax=Massilia sp. KIM TaxID=1955422 RepID=UPI00098FE30E|nr:hypothetical protein [Massilia sp. KIM]OON62992.1 hypothetical protein B0920_06105 [Massilia sp. KIM]
MSTPTPSGPGAPAQDDPSTTLGVGGETSGEQGATRSHETQQETGGNGGDGLSRNQSGETTNAPDGSAGPTLDVAAPDSAMARPGRGAQDTRSSQAGIRDTGLGTPETGGNQSPEDLPPKP